MGTKLVSVLIGLVVLAQVQSSPKDATFEEAASQGQTSSQNGTLTNEVNDNAEGAVAAAASDAANQTEDNVASEETQPDSAAETVENDEDSEEMRNITGMSESLADYIADLLTNSDNTSEGQEEPGASAGNATQPQASDAAAAEADAGSNLTPQAAGGAAGESAGPAAGQEGNDEAAQPGDQAPDTDTGGAAAAAEEEEEEEDDDDDFWDDLWGASENFATPSSSSANPSPRPKEENCSAEVDLQNYCGYTAGALDFFHGDTTVKGLRDAFMDMNIVYSLLSCRRGEWCLEIENDLQVFKDMQEHIYNGPLCSNSMWECIFDVMVLRENCPDDKEFLFVVDVLDVMCSMSGITAFELGARPTEDETNCIAHVQKALHVTYADFLANGMVDAPPEGVASCGGYGFRMTETYLCADNNCKGQYESRQAMEKFTRWSWFMTELDKRVATCTNLKNDTCGPLQGTAPVPTSWFGMTSSSTPFWTSTPAGPASSEDGEDTGGSAEKVNLFGESDESMMILLSVATAVGLLFMVLGLIFFWRRSRRRNAYYYRSVSDSYDKVSGDEAHLLGRSSD